MSNIINTNEPAKQPLLTRKRVVVGALIGVVLLAGSYWFLVGYKGGGILPNKPAGPATPSDARQEAEKLAATENAGSALSYYDQQIALTKDKTTQQQLLLDKAAVAYNNGDTKAALAAAEQADAIKSTVATLDMIGRCYEKTGDTAKALEYYRKELSMVTDNTSTSRMKADLNERISALSGGQ